jgi:hypothetical protein
MTCSTTTIKVKKAPRVLNGLKYVPELAQKKTSGIKANNLIIFWTVNTKLSVCVTRKEDQSTIYNDTSE